MENATPNRGGPCSLGQFAVDEPRSIKVVVIGTGYCGIIAGIRFRQRVQNLDFAIYESNAGVGGTWFANKYPGLVCDIPAHCYQLTFEENKNWSEYYASGPEIKAYLNDVVDKYKLRPFIKFKHRVIRAQYNEEAGKWHLTIRRCTESTADDGSQTAWKNWEEFDDTADVLFAGVGSLSRWTWPDIPGLESFEGKVVHSAQWRTGEGDELGGWQDTVKEWSDKKIGVIGLGSSALQIVSALQPRVKRLINYARGKTWISASYSSEKLKALTEGTEVPNYTFTEKDKQDFQDPSFYKEIRRDLEANLNGAHAVTLRGHPLQIAWQKSFKESMLQKLAKKSWIAEHLIPDFPIVCRRLTPGPGYLEALCEDNCDFVPSDIKQVTGNGIITEDGKFHELDVIICATGFHSSLHYDFPVIGRGGLNLKDHNTPHPRSYLAITVDGFPNYFQALGPNSYIGTGSLLIIAERQVDYAVAATQKIQRERIKSMEVKREAVDDFEQYLESYFPQTVFSEKCRSWYKGGKEEGRIVYLWPGSCLHATKALAHPRWEDYNYEMLDSNRFYWLGDGSTLADKDPEADKAWYLDEVDIPPVPSD